MTKKHPHAEAVNLRYFKSTLAKNENELYCASKRTNQGTMMKAVRGNASMFAWLT